MLGDFVLVEEFLDEWEFYVFYEEIVDKCNRVRKEARRYSGAGG